MSEKTVVLLKPDALKREIIGEVISRFEKKGLKLVALKMMQMTPELSKDHYSHLVDKGFYKELEDFMTDAPIIALVLEGSDAIEVVRKMVGSTNARDAAPGTIRGDFSMSVSKNVIHASDSPESAEAELKRFFKSDEIFEYKRQDYFYSSDEV